LSEKNTQIVTALSGESPANRERPGISRRELNGGGSSTEAAEGVAARQHKIKPQRRANTGSGVLRMDVILLLHT
jgi:hypothetical protein